MIALSNRILRVVLCACFLAVPLAAQGPRAPQERIDVKVDYASARREIQRFEALINETVSTAFKAPYALSQKAKGAYLQGYGVTFSFLVNIHRALVSTPFGDVRRSEDVTPEQKKRRIEDLKEKLVWVMQDNGGSLHQLRRDEAVTIIAFFEDRNFPDEENQNKTVVLSVLKKDLDELAGKNDRSGEFKQRMRIVEY